MNAILYLLRKAYVNKIKRAFSSVMSAVITVFAVIVLGSLFVMAFVIDKPALAGSSAETIQAGIVLFIGMLLYNSFLSRDTGILTMADATYLFTGPFERRTVLAYILISTAPGAALTGFFVCFYMPYLLGPALTLPKFFVVLLIISLMFACIYLSYYYIYIIDTEKTGFKKKAKYVFLGFAGILLAIFLGMLVSSGFRLKATADNYFSGTWYNWVPLFGWTKWAINSILTGNILSGLIPATTLLVIANTALCFALYNCKVDFYEKALEDSVRLQKMLEDIKTHGSADARSTAKLKRERFSIRYYDGAAAIFSRQILENKKVSIMANMREIFLGLFYVVFGKVLNLDFTLVFAMISFGALSMSLNDSWHREFKKPYIFLIPASSFQKVIFSVLPGLVKTMLSGCISLIVGGLAYNIGIHVILAYLILFIGFSILFVFAEVFTYRLFGSGANAVVLTFIRMLFVFVTCIPAIIVLILIMILLQDMPGMLTISLCLLGTNFVSSVLLAFLSRGLFEKSEIMA